MSLLRLLIVKAVMVQNFLGRSLRDSTRKTYLAGYNKLLLIGVVFDGLLLLVVRLLLLLFVLVVGLLLLVVTFACCCSFYTLVLTLFLNSYTTTLFASLNLTLITLPLT